jgi:hypothetical protein
MPETTHIIALSTYGTQTKTRAGRRLSALKIGYTNAVPDVLLALIPSATNISSNRDRYVYIHLPNKPKLHRNWLFVVVDDEELAAAEKITMANPSSRGIALWRDQGWMLFPSLENPAYHDPASDYDVPKGSPHGYRSINSAGETAATGGGEDPDALIAEYSKLDPNKSAWWWIPGNDATYAHRGALKRAGCRWRRNRRAYSYTGDRLPDRLLDLLDNAEECRAIMAGMSPEDAKRKFRHRRPSDAETTDEVETDRATGRIHDDTDEDNDPCTIDDAVDVLGLTVHRDDPPTAYERGRTAWTTRTLAAGIEGREAEIPPGTQYTIRDIDATDDPTNPVYIVDLDNGNRVRILEEELLPQRMFSLGQTVYARHDSETADGTRIRTGHAGTIAKLYRFNPNLGTQRGHTYDVDWEAIGVEWMFEDELAAEPGVTGIQVTRRTVTSVGGQGTTPADERKAIIEAGAKPDALDPPPEQSDCACEAYEGPKGWRPAEAPGTWIACENCNPNGSNMPTATPGDPDAEAPPAVRIIQAAPLNDDASHDDTISSAIRDASNAPVIARKPAATAPVSTQQTRAIPQAYVGELTGSVVANVHCYGYATQAGALIYLNMGGPRSGVEAIRAKLAKGQAVNLVPDEGPSVELTPGDGMTGMYTAFINNMSEARFVSLILVHEAWIDPNYSGDATTYIMQTDEAQAKGQLLHHVRELVSVPVFPEWVDYLWQAGQSAMLIRNCNAGGGITLKSLALDATAWKRLITGGVANDIIHIPQPTTHADRLDRVDQCANRRQHASK